MKINDRCKKKCSQNTVIILCWLVYVIAYLGRYSYNANISLIMDDFKINHATAGVVTTCFFFAYGIGQVVNGLFCAKYNKKFLFPSVLLISSVINILAIAVPFSFFKYMWLLNGFLQAFFVWLGNYRIMFGFAASALVIVGVMTLGKNSAVMMIICFGIVLCLMHGVNNVVTSLGPLKLREKVNPGKIAGILNGFCYLGSTISSYGLGMIADNWGWQSVFTLLLVLCGICMVIGLLYRKNN